MSRPARLRPGVSAEVLMAPHRYLVPPASPMAGVVARLGRGLERSRSFSLVGVNWRTAAVGGSRESLDPVTRVKLFTCRFTCVCVYLPLRRVLRQLPWPVNGTYQIAVDNFPGIIRR